MRHGHGGSSLITALIFLTGIAGLVGIAFTRSFVELLGTTRFVASQEAFHLAEASVDAAIRNLRVGQFDDLATTSMAGGSYWAEVDPATGTLEYLITGHGQRGSEQRQVEARVSLTPTSVFQFALFGGQQIIISGEAITDSYDSSLGAYDPTDPGQDGDVGTNATTTGGVDISGSIAINGQVAVGPDASDPSAVVTTSGGSYLITGSPPIIPQSEALPMPSISVPDGLACTDLTVAGQTTLTLASAVGVYCFSDLNVSGGGTLTADGPVEVYVTGAFTASGDTLIGVPSDPPAMVFFLVSDQQATIEGSLTGSTEFYGGLYAPTATIEISGNAQVFGSVVARVVEISGDAKVHFDEALRDLTEPVGLYQIQILSWQER